jgi:hypothetical protein
MEIGSPRKRIDVAAGSPAGEANQGLEICEKNCGIIENSDYPDLADEVSRFALTN